MKIINKKDYYCLIGLEQLAKRKWREISDLEKAAVEITKEEDRVFGHTSDFIAGSRDIDELLELLSIKVKEEIDKPNNQP